MSDEHKKNMTNRLFVPFQEGSFGPKVAISLCLINYYSSSHEYQKKNNNNNKIGKNIR